jgi:hypothetical protein
LVAVDASAEGLAVASPPSEVLNVMWLDEEQAVVAANAMAKMYPAPVILSS